MPEHDGVYRGPFCTGHTFFPWQAVNFYTETLSHEFREEYRLAHNVRVPRVRPTHVPSLPQKPVRLPLTGTPTGRVLPGGRPPRGNLTTSGIVGGWWKDPIFSEGYQLMRPVTAAPSMQKTMSTASDIGRFWCDSRGHQTDSHTEALRLKNGIKRVHAACNLVHPGSLV
jgi:hypothetical protein